MRTWSRFVSTIVAIVLAALFGVVLLVQPAALTLVGVVLVGLAVALVAAGGLQRGEDFPDPFVDVIEAVLVLGLFVGGLAFVGASFLL